MSIVLKNLQGEQFVLSRVIKPPHKTVTMRSGNKVEFYTLDSIIINDSKAVAQKLIFDGDKPTTWDGWVSGSTVAGGNYYGQLWTRSGVTDYKFQTGAYGDSPNTKWTIATFDDDINNIKKAIFFKPEYAYKLGNDGDGALYLGPVGEGEYQYYVWEENDDRVVPFLVGLDAEVIPTLNDPLSPGGTNAGGGTGSGVGINGTQIGANGTFNAPSDEISMPEAPAVSILDTGLFTMYALTKEQLKAFGQYLWNSDFSDTLKKIFSDPMESIMASMATPFSLVDVPGVDSTLTIGNVATNLSAKKLTSADVTIDCGSIPINGYWGNAMDYPPYTKASIYIPYSGIHDINVNDIMNRTIHLLYRVDLFSGSAVVVLSVTDSDNVDKILYTFSAKVGNDIPLTARDMATFYSQVANTIASAGIGVAGVVAAPATAGASLAGAGVALSTAKNVVSADIAVQHSGRLDSYVGTISPQYPYLIITRPAQSLPEYYNTFRGYPSNITETLGNLSGYTEVAEIHLENVPATNEEIDEIEKLLKGGVIL